MSGSEIKVNWTSGRWTGKWTEPNRPKCSSPNYMFLDLSFSEGRIDGSGKDRIGAFLIRGSYDSKDMTCSFLKCYGSYAVDYYGHRDGKGIYGQWSLCKGPKTTGGFYIWSSGLEEKAQKHREEGERIDVVGEEMPLRESEIVEV